MKFTTALTTICCWIASLGLHAQELAPLTVQKIMKDPKKLIGTSPSGIYWSEDSKSVYFNWNPEKNIADSLYVYSVENKTTRKLTSAELRSLPPEQGVYNKDRSLKLYLKDGDVYLLDIRTKLVRQLTATVDTESDAGFSSDEKKVFFKKGSNLFVVHLSTGELRQYTDFREGKKKEEAVLNDQEKWLKQDQLALSEVLKERKEKKDQREKAEKALKPIRPKEIYLGEKKVSKPQLSPDLRFITYVLTISPKGSQTAGVPNYVTESGFTEIIPTRRKVGAPSEKHELWVYDIERDTTRKVSFDKLEGISDKPDYLKDYPAQDSLWKERKRELTIAGVFFSETGKNAVLVVRSVDNKDRWIISLNTKDLTMKMLDRQRDEAWVAGPGIGYGFSAGTAGWTDESHFYFQSEATGYSHLYLVNVESGQKKQLTSGEFEVQEVMLSNDKKNFYLLTNEVHPGEKHFYRMPVDGGKRVRLTSREGGHEIRLSPDERKLAVRYSDSNTPWELFMIENKPGASYEKITNSVTEEFKSYPWRKPELVTIKASDGKDIFARLYKPARSNGKAVIFVHGAGYLQNAHKWWSQYFREYMFHNLLTDKGYTVLDMDFRASAGYGRDWRTGIYRHMGGKDLSDNVDGAKWLIEKHKIDPAKIGIYGGSYGGFISLMAQFTQPGVFAAGAALRPVADWAAYNHGYTSNILNEPYTDSLAYKRSSPIYHADGLVGKLLICHGMIDVNVHFQDVVRLSQRLIELGKENWELAVYPLEDHGFTEPSSWTDEYRRILKLFEEM